MKKGTLGNAGPERGQPPTLLEEGLSRLPGNPEPGSADRVVSLLARYIEEIELFNPAYGLVKVRDRRELTVKHILDSLAPLCAIRRLSGVTHNGPAGKNTPAIADVGSGAGLPGIPLAICMPGAEFTLIERMGRRAGFLRDAVAVLGLPNVRVEETGMEEFPVNPEKGFDLAVFRAFRPLEPAILKGLFRLLSPNGKIAAWKGRRDSLEEEMAGVLAAAGNGRGPPIGSWEALPLDVPFLEEERHLLVIHPGSMPPGNSTAAQNTRQKE